MRENHDRPDRRNLWAGSGIFLLALIVRLVYLYEASRGPAFFIPIIDSATYIDIARKISGNGVLDPRLFWQSFLYPVYLSVILWATGNSITVARLIQLAAGAFSCVLVFRLGLRIFDRKTGVLAALITAFYGPLFFFEAEILATGWAAFWAVALILIIIETAGKRNIWLNVITGVVSGLAVITRATFLPFAILAMFWIVYSFKPAGIRFKKWMLHASFLIFGFILVMATVATLCWQVTGHFSAIPKSGSINLYVGNNPDTDATLMIRPGAEWRKLVREPMAHGYSTDAEHRKYFMDLFREYMVTDPGGYVKGILGKTAEFFSSRELPRNVDLYTSRRFSRLLSLTTWKWHGFGFPFGILLPFAILGLIRYRSKFPPPVLFFLAIYPLAIIAVFATARYRTVMIPIIAVASAAGVLYILQLSRAGEWKKLGANMILFFVIIVISSVFGPFVTEDYNYEAELYASTGYELSKAGCLDEAEENLDRALELYPEYGAAHRMLGNVLNQKHRYEEASEHFRIALIEDPDSYTVHYYMGVSLWRAGRMEEAARHLVEAKKGAKAAREEGLYMRIENILGMMREKRVDGE